MRILRTDGIYDWTVMSEFKFDWKLRNSGLLNYYRVVGSLGYAKTWWRSNESQVVAPESRKPTYRKYRDRGGNVERPAKENFQCDCQTTNALEVFFYA